MYHLKDLKTKLDELSVYDAVWNQTQNERYYQVIGTI